VFSGIIENIQVTGDRMKPEDPMFLSPHL